MKFGKGWLGVIGFIMFVDQIIGFISGQHLIIGSKLGTITNEPTFDIIPMAFSIFLMYVGFSKTEIK